MEILRAFLLLIVLLPGIATASDFDVESSPILAPENCYKTSPEEVLRQLTAAGWLGGETGIDHALSLYGERVRPLVDERLSKITVARAPLTDAIVGFDRAFQSMTNGNWFGHESARHAATVEWMLITIGTRKFLWDDPRYAHDDLRIVMLIWYRARRIADGSEPQPTEAQFLEKVDAAVASLKRAEAHLSPDQAAHLRQRLMIRIAQWLR